MILHTLEEVENYFKSQGFGVLHYSQGMNDTYVLVVNQNYALKDRMYLEINYTTGRDEDYELVYYPIITDIFTLPEDQCDKFEANPLDETMYFDKQTITDRFDFDAIPQSILDMNLETEFEELLMFIRWKADLNYSADAKEQREKEKRIRNLKIKNIGVMDDIFEDEPFRELDAEVKYTDILAAGAEYKGRRVEVHVTEAGEYIFKHTNDRGDRLIMGFEKQTDRDEFIKLAKEKIKTF